MKEEKPIYRPATQHGDDIVCPQCGNTVDESMYKPEELIIRCRECGNVFAVLHDAEEKPLSEDIRAATNGKTSYLAAAVILLAALLLAFLVSVLKT